MSDLATQPTAPTRSLGDVHRLDEIARLRAEIDQLEAEQITDWNDPRLRTLLEAAEEVASDRSHLQEWAVLSDRFGLKGEERPWIVYADFSARLAIRVPAARTREDAQEIASEVEHIRPAIARHLDMRAYGGITVISSAPDSRDPEDQS